MLVQPGIMSPPVGMGGPPPGLGMAMAAMTATAANVPLQGQMPPGLSQASRAASPQMPAHGSAFWPPPPDAPSSPMASVGHPLLGRPLPEPPATLRAFGAVPQPAPMPVVPQPPSPAQLTAEADWAFLKQEVERILKESTQISAHMHACHLCGSPFDGNPISDNREVANKRLGHAVEVVWGRSSQFAQDIGCWSAELRRSDAEAASLMDFLQEMRIQYVEQVEQRVRMMRAENSVQIRQMEDEIRIRRASLPAEIRPPLRKESSPLQARDAAAAAGSDTPWPPPLSPLLSSLPQSQGEIRPPPLAALASVPLPAGQAAQLVSPMLPGIPQPVNPTDAASTWAMPVPQPSALPVSLNAPVGDTLLRSLNSSSHTLPPNLMSSATLPPTSPAAPNEQLVGWAPVVEVRQGVNDMPNGAILQGVASAKSSPPTAAFPGSPYSVTSFASAGASAGVANAIATGFTGARESPVVSPELAHRSMNVVESVANSAVASPVLGAGADLVTGSAQILQDTEVLQTSGGDSTELTDSNAMTQKNNVMRGGRVSRSSSVASRPSSKESAARPASRNVSRADPSNPVRETVASRARRAANQKNQQNQIKKARQRPAAPPDMGFSAEAPSAASEPLSSVASDPIFNRVRSALKRVNERSEEETQAAKAMTTYTSSAASFPSAPQDLLSPTLITETVLAPRQPLSPEQMQAEAFDIFNQAVKDIPAIASSSSPSSPVVMQATQGTAYPASPQDHLSFNSEALHEMIARAAPAQGFVQSSQPPPRSLSPAQLGFVQEAAPEIGASASASSGAAQSGPRRTTTARARGAALSAERSSQLKKMTAEKEAADALRNGRRASAASVNSELVNGGKEQARQQASASRSPAPRGAGQRRGNAANSDSAAPGSDPKFSADHLRKFLQGSGSGSLRDRKWA